MALPKTAAPAAAPFTLSRIFNAPRERVWSAWTNEAQLKQWFGPKDCPLTHCKLDLREGGVFHYGMQMPDGSNIWGKWTFREIKAPELLSVITSFTDAQGSQATRHPWSPSWPLETLSTTQLIDLGNGKTEMRLTWETYKATAEEQATFDAGHDSMTQGWGGTMEQLEAFLAK